MSFRLTDLITHYQVLQSQVTREVRNSVTAVVCVITKHEFSSWPELLNFITAACFNDNIPAKEVSGVYRVRNYRGKVTNFNQSEARKHCFLASDWSKFETLPR